MEPAQKFPPSEHVSVLFEYPPQPHIKLALIEAQGLPGGTEAELFDDARKRAAALGADAIVRLEITSVHQPPVLLYDPVYDPLLYRHYPYPYGRYYYAPYPSPFYPRSGYRWVDGGDVKTLKAMAIRFEDRAPPPTPPAN